MEFHGYRPCGPMTYLPHTIGALASTPLDPYGRARLWPPGWSPSSARASGPCQRFVGLAYADDLPLSVADVQRLLLLLEREEHRARSCASPRLVVRVDDLHHLGQRHPRVGLQQGVCSRGGTGVVVRRVGALACRLLAAGRWRGRSPRGRLFVLAAGCGGVAPASFRSSSSPRARLPRPARRGFRRSAPLARGASAAPRACALIASAP